MKYIPYVPPAPKAKTRSMAKSKVKAKPSMTEYNVREDGSPKNVRDWANIDDFVDRLLDSNVLRSLDRGLPALAIGVEEMNLAVERLFNESSLEFPLVLDDNAAGASHSIGDIESGGGLQEYQDDDLDAAGMCALAVENTGGVYNDSLPEQDEPHDDVGITTRPSALADCSSQISSLRTRNDLNAGYRDSGSKDLYGGEDKSRGTGSEVGDSDEDELNWANDISGRAATVTFQQRTRAVHDRSTSYGPSDHVDYQPTDVTLCQVPECTTLATAIVCWNELTSKSSLKPLTIVRDLLGNAGQLIRMTQVMSDSWLLVGCRYNDVLNVYASRSSTQRSSDSAAWKSGTRSPHRKGASYNAVGPDEDEDDRDDGFENGGQSSGSESSGGSNSDASAADDHDERRHGEHKRVYPVHGAVQGLSVAALSITKSTVLGVTCTILIVLFLVQPFGVTKISVVFAPVVIIWSMDGGAGGGILLAFTGVEALFANIGAFSRQAIQLSWLVYTYPCLLLAYTGQAAYISRHPGAYSNPFYHCAPPGWVIPGLVIAILAAIVASQAIITATFQLMTQIMKLSYFPQICVVHTSKTYHGQLYVPAVNWLLMVGTVPVASIYNKTTSLGNAYGACVTFVTFFDTCMVTLVAILVRRIRPYFVFLPWLAIALLDGTFLSSALTKVPDSAWFTIALLCLVASIFILWRFGKEQQWFAGASDRFPTTHFVRTREDGKLQLSSSFGNKTLSSIEGFGTFFDKAGETTPIVFSQFIRKLVTAPGVIVFFHLRPLEMPFGLPSKLLIPKPGTILQGCLCHSILPLNERSPVPEFAKYQHLWLVLPICKCCSSNLNPSLCVLARG
ncbi:hypothetical protein K469DRAFT_750282 [Zopfia rhizophila CBS 207.26]|uniref:K+ potassium transporter integral membrane domain-containing protein n=1 Tax=Zopfia rhizophila CBS 207.26 TaxID=1314779 RepID=A0A6A6E459_9PEZI|nr:hypothetical protein K469DRAFT_750282 [Zopfia rhizophila CBS 207.26]